MLLTVFDRNNQKRTDLSPNDNGTQVKEIQADNILTLSFTLYEHIALDVNDYVDYMGERYWLMEKYRPKQKSTVEWEYNVKLYGIESLIKRFLVLKTVDGEDEPVFTLTAPPREHVAMIVQCINDGMGDITDFKVGTVEGTENITIDYEGKYCDAALKEIAEKVGAEWWAEGQTFNVCRCEHGEEITLGYGKGLTEIDNDTADNAKFYTRLFPIGSSKNIDREKYGYSRLQLPSKARYVDVNTDKYGIIHHYEASAFADIFPRRVGIVSSVRCEEVTGEDGNPFKIYYFRDDSLNFDPNEYELPQLVKRVSFQEGSELAGQGNEEDGNYFFEVNYNSDTREFEIITIWPYDNDLQLPNDTLIPKDRDRYILWNIRMPSEYYTLAEEEFLTAVEKYNEQHAIDVSRYKAPTDHVYIEDNNIDLFVGRRVRLESNKYFPEAGYRKSRITKITRKVNMPSQMDIEISDALSTGSLTKLGDDITDVKNYTKGIADSISLPDIIRSWDNTLPTDNNLFSARRSQQEFLSKTKADRAKKRITFEEGADFGDYEQGEHGGTVDGKGNAELLSLVVRELLRSAKYVDGLTGEGFQLWIDGRGLANLTLDRLTVRQIMTVFEMLIQKVRSVGGQIVVSAANGKIKSVELVDGYYKITFEQENTFVAHDLMRAATFTGGTLKSYWVEIAAIEGNSVLVAEEEFDSPPEVADECVLMGNTENPLHQSLISIAATEDGQPRIDVINGVNSKSFAGCLRARLGNLDGVKDDSFPLDRQPQGYGLYADNVYLRGTFLLDTGEDIKTQFKIAEGKINAAVEGLRQDFVEDKGFLSNPTFGYGMAKWNTTSEVTFFLAGNKWIWANGHILSNKENYAIVATDDGRTVLHIHNRYIKQLNSNLRSLPTFESNDNGELEAVPVYLSFFYRCAKPGTLKVEFENVDKNGFANFNSLSVEEELAVTDGYRQYTCSGLWNGTGNFCLSFTGDIYLYMLVLSTDRIESLTYKYRTLFEQSEKLVKIAADCVDKDGNVIKLSELKVTVNGITSEVSNAKGEISSIKQTVSGITSEVSNAKGEISSIKQTVSGITTKVADTEGRMSAIEQTASGIKKTVGSLQESDGGYLYNSSFFEGMVGWEQMLLVPSDWSEVKTYDENGLQLLKLKTSGIKQANSKLVGKPAFDTAKNYPVSFSAKVRYKTPGDLFVIIDNKTETYYNGYHYAVVTETSAGAFVGRTGSTADKSMVTLFDVNNVIIKKGDVVIFNLEEKIAFVNGTKHTIGDIRLQVGTLYNSSYSSYNKTTNALYVPVGTACDTFSVLKCVTEWNGDSDFVLIYTGEADFFNLSLRSDENLLKYQTLFEQTDSLVNIVASHFNTDGTVKSSSNIFVKPSTAGLITRDSSGNISTIGTYEGGVVKISANNIKLEGIVTANDYFKILTDGKIEAKGGSIGDFTINGSLQSTGNFYKFSLNSGGLSFADLDGNFGLGSPVYINIPNSNLSLPAIYVNCKDGKDAIKVDSGVYAGFRMNVKRWGSNATLTDLNNVILATNSADTTIEITLPKSPKTAQFYMIKPIGGGSVKVLGNGHKIKHAITGDRAAVDDITLTSQRYWCFFVWDATSSSWILGD